MNIVTGVVGALTATAAMLLASPHADEVRVFMPTCQYEDGNPDGEPCRWVNPDNGKGFVNDGHNYRD